MAGSYKFGFIEVELHADGCWSGYTCTVQTLLVFRPELLNRPKSRHRISGHWRQKNFPVLSSCLSQELLNSCHTGRCPHDCCLRFLIMTSSITRWVPSPQEDLQPTDPTDSLVCNTLFLCGTDTERLSGRWNSPWRRVEFHLTPHSVGWRHMVKQVRHIAWNEDNCLFVFCSKGMPHNLFHL